MYIPSGALQEIYVQRVCTALASLISVLHLNMKDNLFIFGDFNFPSVNWTYDFDNISVLLLPIDITSDMNKFLIYSLLGNGL